MSFDADRLYSLLPAIYRIRDYEQGEPLKAFLAVLAEQAEVIEEDLAQLYDDQFIETCADWVVPYIGDLIGYRRLHGVTSTVSSPRAEVANTIAYRRRKGTVSVVEQLALDVTGWKACAVEFFQLLGTTQYLNHLRPNHRSTADLRQQSVLALRQTPFGQVAHTLDVRRIASRRGRYNIPNVGLFVWRLRPYRINRGTAKRVKEGCYTCHPLGLDIPLFNPGRGEEEITHLAEPVNVPEPLRRRPLYDELETMRQTLANGQPEGVAAGALVYFDPRQPVFEVFNNGTPIPPKEILICDLSDWRQPPNKLSYRPAGKRPGDPTPDPELPIQVAVDPVLGRMAFPIGTSLDAVNAQVGYSYGCSDDLGGGPYAKPKKPSSRVVMTAAAGLAQSLTTIGINDGVIEITDSATIEDDLTITLGAQQDLTIRVADGERPVIHGTVTIASAEEAEITLNGLMIAKMVRVTGAARITLVLQHCTLPPIELGNDLIPRPLGTPSVRWAETGQGGTLFLDRAVTGRMVVGPDVRVEASDCIIDAVQDAGVALAASEDGKTSAGSFRAVRTTVIGAVHVQELELADNSLFTGVVTSEQKQTGCVRFSYLPLESQVPRRYRCQPDFAITQAVEDAMRRNPNAPSPELDRIAAAIRSSLRPDFTSRQFAHSGYMQLHASCAVEIRSGAVDGSEMGVFHDLFQVQRETNLRARLEEYLRFGLETGVFFVT
jgi:hypothetical protein